MRARASCPRARWFGPSLTAIVETVPSDPDDPPIGAARAGASISGGNQRADRGECWRGVAPGVCTNRPAIAARDHNSDAAWAAGASTSTMRWPATRWSIPRLVGILLLTCPGPAVDGERAVAVRDRRYRLTAELSPLDASGAMVPLAQTGQRQPVTGPTSLAAAGSIAHGRSRVETTVLAGCENESVGRGIGTMIASRTERTRLEPSPRRGTTNPG